jgi:protoporphyrinogen oxidase
MSAHVVVIGAGPAGLRAAFELARQGLRVSVVEGANALGGLAGWFDIGGVSVERYYHFVCKGDDHLITTLSLLGLEARLRWRRTRMAHFVDGALYPFLTPIDLLRFRPLPFVDRLRAGVALKRAQRMREEDLAPQRAVTWLKGLFGEAAYHVVWEPLLRFKFAEYTNEVSAAWIWARMVRLSRSRSSPWYEELGHLEGGSAVVLEALGRETAARGGRILLGAPASAILFDGERVTGVRAGDETLPADAVVSTVTLGTFRRLLPDAQRRHFDRLARIPAIGVYCAVLRLSRAVTPVFWVNANDPRIPFAGMIEYTNLNPLPELGGDRLLYIPQYCSHDDPRYARPDEAILAAYQDALALINPAFDPSWVRFAAVFRDRFAQPICLTDYLTTTPSITTAVRGVYVTDASQLHPHDRSISGAFGLGQEAARLAIAGLGAESGRP